MRVKSFEVGLDFGHVEGFEDFYSFATDATDDLTSLLARSFVLRPFSRVPLFLLSLFVEYDGVLSVPRVRREADQCHSLWDLDHLLVQRGDSLDVQVENLGSRLITDAEEVFEAAPAKVKDVARE